MPTASSPRSSMMMSHHARQPMDDHRVRYTCIPVAHKFQLIADVTVDPASAQQHQLLVAQQLSIDEQIRSADARSTRLKDTPWVARYYDREVPGPSPTTPRVVVTSSSSAAKRQAEILAACKKQRDNEAPTTCSPTSSSTTRSPRSVERNATVGPPPSLDPIALAVASSVPSSPSPRHRGVVNPHATPLRASICLFPTTSAAFSAAAGGGSTGQTAVNASSGRNAGGVGCGGSGQGPAAACGGQNWRNFSPSLEEQHRSHLPRIVASQPIPMDQKDELSTMASKLRALRQRRRAESSPGTHEEVEGVVNPNVNAMFLYDDDDDER